MKKQSETNNATSRILKFLLNAGVFAWRHNVVPVPGANGSIRTTGKKGVPDILGIYGGGGLGNSYGHPKAAGQFVGIEIKKGKDKVRPEQEGFHTQARKLGAIMIVAAGKTADEIFDNFLKQWQTMTQK